jgi:methyl-accepting chemotaxis protein
VEQARGVEHIGRAIARIEAVTQNNAANAQQTAEHTEKMIAQVETTGSTSTDWSRWWE